MDPLTIAAILGGGGLKLFQNAMQENEKRQKEEEFKQGLASIWSDTGQPSSGKKQPEEQKAESAKLQETARLYAKYGYQKEALSTAQKAVETRADEDETEYKRNFEMFKLMSEKLGSLEAMDQLLERFPEMKDTLDMTPDESEIPTYKGVAKLLTGSNPLNNNEQNRFMYYPDGSINFPKVAGKYIGPQIERSAEVLTEAFFAKNPNNYSVATKKQLANPDLERNIYTAQDTGRQFIQYKEVPEKDKRSIVQMQQSQEALAGLVDKMRRYGLKPDPVTGRLPVAGSFINNMIKSPEWLEWKGEVNRVLTDTLRATSGLTVRSGEEERIKFSIPTTEDRNPEVFMRKALSTINSLSSYQNKLVQMYDDQGYDTRGLDFEPVNLSTGQREKPKIRINSFEEYVSALEKKLGRKLSEKDREQAKGIYRSKGGK
jgi:hypothetical protein